MKPLIIAGNGPSLAQIDYSRLPLDFEVFRCNQFYFEDHYFLGKKIQGVFFNPSVLKEQFFTLHHLKARGEYEVRDVYCNITMGSWDRQTTGEGSKVVEGLKYDFPSVKSTYPYLEQMKDFDALHKFYALYYNKRFTAGIIMLIVALAQGYEEIYLTGIDFYEEGGLSYAFEIKDKSHLLQKIPTFAQEGFKDEVHEKSVDIDAIQFALQTQSAKLYSLNPNSTMSKIVGLAPQRKKYFQLMPKPQGYICDLLPLPQHMPAPPPSEKEEIAKKSFWMLNF